MNLPQPVLDEHKAFLGPESVESIENSLKGLSPQEVSRAVRVLIARDVGILLQGVKESEAERARVRVRNAVLQWRLIELDAVKVDFRATQLLSESFRDLKHAIEDGDIEARDRLASDINHRMRILLD